MPKIKTYQIILLSVLTILNLIFFYEKFLTSDEDFIMFKNEYSNLLQEKKSLQIENEQLGEIKELYKNIARKKANGVYLDKEEIIFIESLGFEYLDYTFPEADILLKKEILENRQ